MKNLKNLALALITGLTLLATSCSTDEIAPTTDASKVMERIDIKIVGEDTEYFYNESLQAEASNDLVAYNFYGNQSEKIDFIVKIDEFRTLVVKVSNKLNPNPWEVIDTYGTFTPQDQDDKYKHATIELIDNQNSENSKYVSNVGENIPQGGFLDVFRIEKYSVANKETLCRLKNIVLYQLEDPNNTIIIDGTFRGALTFL
ncbi:MAG: hypothetical protein R2753_10335 [Chitinophagales bacterium]